MKEEEKAKIKEGLRFNTGKLRYDLMEPFAQEQKALIFTRGAMKYAERNWEKGMDWDKCFASAKRHAEAYARGEDYDIDHKCEGCIESVKAGIWVCTNHTGALHSALAAWNWDAITSYYKIYPQGDDRNHWFKKPFKDVWLDIDGILANYEDHFLEYLSLPKDHPTDWNDERFRNHWKDIVDDSEFWKTIPALIRPEEITYPIKGYITSRPCSDELTMKWLTDHGFPVAELVNVYPNTPKSDFLKDKPNIITIDDSIKNFVDYHNSGVLCYLKTRPHNVKYEVGHFRVDNIQQFMTKLMTG